MTRLGCTLAILVSLVAASLGTGQPFRGRADRTPVQITQPLPRPEPVNGDEVFLRRAGIGTDPAALLALLRNHGRSEIDKAQLDKLVQQLGSEEFDQREQASRAIAVLGRPALKRLAAAQDEPDSEIRRRAGAAIEEIQKSLDRDAAYAAVRELIRQQPPGAAEALIGCVTDADADVEEEIYFGLARIAFRDGKADPALRAALSDTNAARRALAALVLGRLGNDADRAAVRTCLADTDPNVRLRAAQGLLAAHDDAALPVLIALLDSAPIDISWQAEELLRWVGGGSGPAGQVGLGDLMQRRGCRAGWQTWLRDNSAVDWRRVAADPRRPGLVLCCTQAGLALVGCSGKPVWKIEDVEAPADAHLLPGGRLLIVEQGGNAMRVIEREVSGKVIWDYKSRRGEDYLACQRLPNGNTFIVSDEGLTEVTPGQHQVYFSEQNDEYQIFDGFKRRNGPLLCLTGNSLRVIDPVSGATLRRHNLQVGTHNITTTNSKLCALQDGGVLLNRFTEGKVLHIDTDGAVLWETAVARPASVAALRNGNIVASTSQRDQRLIEVSRTGQTVWETRGLGQVSRVRPCFNLLRVGLDGPRPADFNVDSVAHRTAGLKDPDPLVRRASAEALADFGERATPAIPALVVALADGDNAVPPKAASALARIGPAAAPALIKALSEGAPTVRDAAATALGEMGDGAKLVVPDLIGLLADVRRDLEVRRATVRVLGYLGSTAAPAANELLAALKAEDYVLRYLSASSLGRVGGPAADVVPALIAAIDDPVHLVKRHAIQALSSYGSAAKEAVPALLEVVQDVKTEVDVRRTAVETLGAIGEAASKSVPTFTLMLKDQTAPADLRAAVAGALAHMGPMAKEALPVFLEILKDEKSPAELTNVLAQTLRTGFGKDGISVLVKAAKEGSRPARLAAIQSLSLLPMEQRGPPSREVADALKEIAAKDTDAVIRAQATRALTRLEGRGRRGRMIEP